MTGHTGSTADNELVKVAYASDQSEAELLQGLLRTVDVNSVVRRAGRSARGDPGDPEPPAPSGGDRGDRPSRRLLAGLLIPVALVGLVVCLFTDVIV